MYSASPLCMIRRCSINSSPPNAAYMRQWTGSAVVQMMAYRLIGAKPFSEPMLGYCQTKFRLKNYVIFIQITKNETLMCIAPERPECDFKNVVFNSLTDWNPHILSRQYAETSDTKPA